MQLIRKKASDEEIEPVIAEIEKLAKEHGVEDPMVPSTDAFVTSICYVGSKSLSHVLSCIERNKERLLAIGPRSAAARRQIITSVMEYWVDQPGVAINIIDKLLNYTILTPLSVIEWALIDHIDAGKVLAKAHIYEMISATVGKVTNLAMFNLLGGFNAYVMDFGVGIVYLVGSLFDLESIRFE